MDINVTTADRAIDELIERRAGERQQANAAARAEAEGVRRRAAGSADRRREHGLVPRTCTVCAHDLSFEINEALALRKASNRSIAKQYGLHHSAVQRHREHIPQLLVKADEAEKIAKADELLMDVRRLQARTLQTLHAAEKAGELRTVLAAVREARHNIALLAEMRGQLDRRPQINLVFSSEWLELRALIVGALEPYPAARSEVLRAIAEASNGSA